MPHEFDGSDRDICLLCITSNNGGLNDVQLSVRELFLK